MLSGKKISYKADDKYLLEPTDVSFEPGKFHVIMGPNGAGKSTLMKLLAGNMRPHSGKVLLNDKELSQYSKKELAVKRAVLSQHYNITFPITVDEVIMMGRYPYFGSAPGHNDIMVCQQAKDLLQMESFADRDYFTLSGGEAQKVQMCRVLAQIGNESDGSDKIIFLDEPVSHLDIAYQYQLLHIARELCSRPATVIAILHDINLALAFGDHFFFLKHGRMISAIHHPDEINEAIIEEVFGIKSSILRTKENKPFIVPVPVSHYS